MVLENKLEALVSELESLQGIIDEATKENVDADRRNRFLKGHLVVLQRKVAQNIDNFAERSIFFSFRTKIKAALFFFFFSFSKKKEK